jgi:hypothetical protein
MACLMASARLKALQVRTKDLRRLLLPHKFDATGIYRDEHRVRARALSFRVLAHAEIETYFEDRVVEIAKVAWASWKNRRHLSTAGLHLLAFSGRQMNRPPETKDPPTDNKKKQWAEQVGIDGRLGASISDFIYRMENENHGIKEKNVLSMLLPVGCECDKIDGLLLATLSQFGADRGAAAHSSTAKHLTIAIDPKDEYDRVARIISDLGPIDAELDAILAGART